MRFLLLAGFGVALAAAVSAQEERAPVPPAAELKRAEGAVRELFKEEYKSKDPEARRGLAQKLRAEAKDAKNDLTTRYVLLRDARDFAAEAADLELAFDAIDALGALFDVKVGDLRGDAISAARKAARSPLTAERAAYAVLDAVYRSVDRSEFEDASRALRDVEPFLKAAQSTSLTQKVADLQKEIPSRKKESDEAKKAELALATNPADGDACLKLGRFLCFVKGDWAAGCSLLKKGPDPVLRKLAEQELGVGEDSESRQGLGEAWLAAADKSKKDKERYEARALQWFELALVQAGGLAKTRIQKRVTELTAVPRGSGGVPVNLLALADPAKDKIGGAWKVEGGALTTTGGFYQFPYQLPEEYDISLLAVQKERPEVFRIPVLLGGVYALIWIDTRGDGCSIELSERRIASPESKFVPDLFKDGKFCNVLVSVRRTRVILKVNDKAALDWPVDLALMRANPHLGELSDRKAFALAPTSPFTFHRIVVTPVTGAGKKLR
jgi:hypothetical protein